MGASVCTHAHAKTNLISVSYVELWTPTVPKRFITLPKKKRGRSAKASKADPACGEPSARYNKLTDYRHPWSKHAESARRESHASLANIVGFTDIDAISSRSQHLSHFRSSGRRRPSKGGR